MSEFGIKISMCFVWFVLSCWWIINVVLMVLLRFILLVSNMWGVCLLFIFDVMWSWCGISDMCVFVRLMVFECK